MCWFCFRTSQAKQQLVCLTNGWFCFQNMLILTGKIYQKLPVNANSGITPSILNSHTFSASRLALAFPESTKPWCGLQDLNACMWSFCMRVCIYMHARDLGLVSSTGLSLSVPTEILVKAQSLSRNNQQFVWWPRSVVLSFWLSTASAKDCFALPLLLLLAHHIIMENFGQMLMLVNHLERERQRDGKKEEGKDREVREREQAREFTHLVTRRAGSVQTSGPIRTSKQR